MRPAHCQLRSWSEEPPDPFKRGRAISPLRLIPGAQSPTMARPDILHCFNLGAGADLAAGGLVAMARMQLFPGRSIQSRLDEAFDSFMGWCRDNKRTPHMKCFELKKFKMTSFLDLLVSNFKLHVFIKMYHSRYTLKIVAPGKVEPVAHWATEGSWHRVDLQVALLGIAYEWSELCGSFT